MVNLFILIGVECPLSFSFLCPFLSHTVGSCYSFKPGGAPAMIAKKPFISLHNHVLKLLAAD